MHNQLILAAALMLALPSWLTAQSQPGLGDIQRFLTLPQHSVAVTDDALSPIVNPAGLGVPTGESFFLIAPYLSKADFGDWGFALGGDGFGFTGEVVSNAVFNHRRYAWGLGFGDDGLYAGLAYSWTTHINRQNNWDLGVLYRPYRFASFGAVMRGINRPRIQGEKSNPGYDLGVALRPLALFGPIGRDSDNRLTLTGDVAFRKYQARQGVPDQNYGDEIGLKVGAHSEVIPGVTLQVDWLNKTGGVHARDAQIWAGAALDFGLGGGGVFQRHGNGHGVAYTRSHDLYHPTWLRPKKKKAVEVSLQGAIAERDAPASLFRPRYKTVWGFSRQIERLSKTPDVKAVLLKIGPLDAGWAKLAQMRRALEAFKADGGKIYVYMESAGNGEYYLASVADKIYMPYGGDLSAAGLSAHMVFLKGTLDKIGIDPQLGHIGDYKSASDMFTRNDMSEAQEEATNAILDDLYNVYIDAIASGRGLSADSVRSLIDEGPYSSEGAAKAGLIDSLAYEDQLEDILKAQLGEELAVVTESSLEFHRSERRDWDDLRRRSVAVIYGSGAITSGASSDGGLFGGETMGSRTIAKAIKDAREDDEVAAIVLRVDSPGGSGAASELILREVARCTEGEERKPVIVSMSDVAASGGYYVACKADTIVAEASTITGSIGVISGKFTYDGLQRKIGMNTATLRRGKHADMFGGHRSFSDEEWKKLSEYLNEFYQMFLSRVAEGRGMDTSAVNLIAQGRIWSGAAAKERGLVDLLGGLDLAVEIAARAGGIEDKEEFEVVVFPESDFALTREFRTLMRAVLPEPLLRAADEISLRNRFGPGDVLFLMPYTLRIE